MTIKGLPRDELNLPLTKLSKSSLKLISLAPLFNKSQENTISPLTQSTAGAPNTKVSPPPKPNALKYSKKKILNLKNCSLKKNYKSKSLQKL